MACVFAAVCVAGSVHQVPFASFAYLSLSFRVCVRWRLFRHESRINAMIPQLEHAKTQKQVLGAHQTESDAVIARSSFRLKLLLQELSRARDKSAAVKGTIAFCVAFDRVSFS